ncbi:ion transporter [candidate division KSB1 bacterium]|nr:ion transporter [candidate division KSB1 bacterium]
MNKNPKSKTFIGRRARLHEIIFEADTKAGKAFDVLLILSIALSVSVVMLSSIKNFDLRFGGILDWLEWFFTVLFTLEYITRLYCVGRPGAYATSFYGIVDLLGIAPSYLSLLFPGSQYLVVIRVIRVLRIFRVLKLVQYVKEAQNLISALKASRRKILVFLFSVLALVVVFGSLMYIIEGEKNGFTSIPRSIYWAIVTLTTVGYGDISPQTGLGQAIAAVIMICGYGIIAVPTGIVTVELAKQDNKNISTQVCRFCNAEGHDFDAVFCKYC